MSKLIEEWRPIDGYEDCYYASDWGRVKSLNYNHTGKEKLLKYAVDKKGYLYVVLCKDGKRKNKKIHQLVAIAFIPNPDGLPQVNHKDEDKTNNRVENLEWCTHEYNINYGTRNKRIAETHTNGRKSKPVYQYTLDGMLVKIWPSSQECGRNGFDHSAVSKCCRNKYMREGNNVYKNFIWKYGD